MLEVLYAYCLTLRLFNGEYAADPIDAASMLVGTSSVLSAAAAARSKQTQPPPTTTASTTGSAAPDSHPLPTSAKVRLLLG